jgi:hypothetical protein
MRKGASVCVVVVIGLASACGFKATGRPLPTSPQVPNVTSAPSQALPEVPPPPLFSPAPSPTHLSTPTPTAFPTPTLSPSRATGTATFLNHCGADVTIRQGAQVAAGSVVFDLLQTATAPSNGSVPISIRAVQAGSKGNVAAGAINTVVGGTFPCMNVYNVSPTTGGTD